MKVLFFTPFFGKTGSEMCLLDLLLQANSQYFETGICVTFGNGELISRLPGAAYFNYPDFRKQQIEILQAKNKGISSLFKKALKFTGLFQSDTEDNDRYDFEAYVKKILADFKPDVCYVNTILLDHTLKILKASDVKRIIMHVHESPDMLSGLSADALTRLIQNPDLIIAPSQKTVKMFNLLGRNFNINAFNVVVNFDRIVIDLNRVKQLKVNHNITSDQFVWAMSGTIDPNKDACVFVELAKRIINSHTGTKFIWLGKGQTGYAHYVKALADSYGLKENVLWIEPNDADYYNYLSMCTAFILTSRQDTFPLVMLEAAYLGKPIVSFNSGGVTEFLGDKYKNLVVNDRSLNEMEILMNMVMNNEVEINVAELKTMAEKFSAKNNYQQWAKMICADKA